MPNVIRPNFSSPAIAERARQLQFSATCNGVKVLDVALLDVSWLPKRPVCPVLKLYAAKTADVTECQECLVYLSRCYCNVA